MLGLFNSTWGQFRRPCRQATGAGTRRRWRRGAVITAAGKKQNTFQPVARAGGIPEPDDSTEPWGR